MGALVAFWWENLGDKYITRTCKKGFSMESSKTSCI